MIALPSFRPAFLGNKPAITHLAIFGDSRAGQSGATTSISSAGVLYWAQMASQSRLAMLENPNPSGTGVKSWSFSSGGQTFGSLNNDAGSFPRVAELISAASAVAGKVVAFLYCGANGMSNPATEYTNFATVVTRLRAAGIYVVAFTEPYLGESQTGSLWVSERNTYNANVIEYCTANSVPLVRGMELYTNGSSQSFDYLFNNDGGFIHPNARGAATIGIELARVIEANFKGTWKIEKAVRKHFCIPLK
jgi:lysophospholipase L1-like esterase